MKIDFDLPCIEPTSFEEILEEGIIDEATLKQIISDIQEGKGTTVVRSPEELEAYIEGIAERVFEEEETLEVTKDQLLPQHLKDKVTFDPNIGSSGRFYLKESELPINLLFTLMTSASTPESLQSTFPGLSLEEIQTAYDVIDYLT